MVTGGKFKFSEEYKIKSELTILTSGWVGELI